MWLVLYTPLTFLPSPSLPSSIFTYIFDEDFQCAYSLCISYTNLFWNSEINRIDCRCSKFPFCQFSVNGNKRGKTPKKRRKKSIWIKQETIEPLIQINFTTIWANTIQKADCPNNFMPTRSQMNYGNILVEKCFDQKRLAGNVPFHE